MLIESSSTCRNLRMEYQNYLEEKRETYNLIPQFIEDQNDFCFVSQQLNDIFCKAEFAEEVLLEQLGNEVLGNVASSINTFLDKGW